MSSSPTPGTIVQLIQLTRSVYRRLSEDVLGMKLKAYLTLSNLRDAPVSQSDLCAAMHLDPNNCVLLLNDLEAAGYAQRRRDPADRRRHIVEITPAGRKAMASAERAIESLEAEVLAGLAPEEREALRGMLARALAGEPVPTA
jgi:MarR family transcriptional regulator, temperature-dependent positive regulator of motility